MSTDLLRIALCRLDELSEFDSRGFAVECHGQAIDLFLVRKSEAVYGYKNSCPHTGAPLDWVADQFLNIDGDLIQCAMHDALFQIDDGVCVSGPCVGQKLSDLKLVVEAGVVWFVPELV